MSWCECRKRAKSLQIALKGAHVVVLCGPALPTKAASAEAEEALRDFPLHSRTLASALGDVFSRPVKHVSVADLDAGAGEKVSEVWCTSTSPAHAPSAEECESRLARLSEKVQTLAQQNQLVLLDGTTLYRAFGHLPQEDSQLATPGSNSSSSEFITSLIEDLKKKSIPCTRVLLAPHWKEFVKMCRIHSTPKECWSSLVTYVGLFEPSVVCKPTSIMQIQRRELRSGLQGLCSAGTERNAFESQAVLTAFVCWGFTDSLIEMSYLCPRYKGYDCIVPLSSTSATSQIAKIIAKSMSQDSNEKLAKGADELKEESTELPFSIDLASLVRVLASAPTSDASAALSDTWRSLILAHRQGEQGDGEVKGISISKVECPAKRDTSEHWLTYEADTLSKYEGVCGVYRLSAYVGGEGGVPVRSAPHLAAPIVGKIEMTNGRHSPAISTMEKFINPASGEVWVRLCPAMYSIVEKSSNFKPHNKSTEWVLVCSTNECHLVPIEPGSAAQATWKRDPTILFGVKVTRIFVPQYHTKRWFPWSADYLDARFALRYDDGDVDPSVGRDQIILQVPPRELIETLRQSASELNSVNELLKSTIDGGAEHLPNDGESVGLFLWATFQSPLEMFHTQVVKFMENKSEIKILKTLKEKGKIAVTGKDKEGNRILLDAFRILPSVTHVRLCIGLEGDEKAQREMMAQLKLTIR